MERRLMARLTLREKTHEFARIARRIESACRISEAAAWIVQVQLAALIDVSPAWRRFL
jgi:hypothetical protein